MPPSEHCPRAASGEHFWLRLEGGLGRKCWHCGYTQHIRPGFNPTFPHQGMSDVAVPMTSDPVLNSGRGK